MFYKEFFGKSFNENSFELDLEKIKEDTFNKKETVNILLMGATGVGKSALVNAVFGSDVALSGNGKPVTQGIERFDLKSKGLILWDTRGIETDAYLETLSLIEKEIESTLNTLDKSKAPHIAWICISEASNRIQDSDKKLVEIAKKFGIPSIIVFTKTQFEAGEDFFKKAKDILNEDYGDFIQNRYVRVNSQEITINGIKIPKKGLDELVKLTETCLSEAQENVARNFKRIQRVNNKKRLDAMCEEARSIVNVSSAAALAAGASPIPGSDAPIIAAIQSTMIYKINSVFELSSEKSITLSLLTGILGITALAQVGKTAFSNILKFIPVAGSFIGGTISGVTAAGITKAVGEAYIAVLKHYYNEETGEVELPDNVDIILTLFKSFYKN